MECLLVLRDLHQLMGALRLAAQPVRQGVATVMMMMTKMQEVIGLRSMTSAESFYLPLLLYYLWNRPITGQS